MPSNRASRAIEELEVWIFAFIVICLLMGFSLLLNVAEKAVMKQLNFYPKTAIEKTQKT